MYAQRKQERLGNNTDLNDTDLIWVNLHATKLCCYEQTSLLRNYKAERKREVELNQQIGSRNKGLHYYSHMYLGISFRSITGHFVRRVISFKSKQQHFSNSSYPNWTQKKFSFSTKLTKFSYIF